MFENVEKSISIISPELTDDVFLFADLCNSSKLWRSHYDPDTFSLCLKS